MSLVFGSVCSGIGAPETAWRGLGWRCAFMSEIDAFPRAVLSHHYGDVPLHGDFTTIQRGDYADIDLLVGGTPCQSFSVAGLRGGMADARGNLALEFLRLADRLRPRWMVWENVPGVLSSNEGRDFGAFLGGVAECGYGFAYRVLDAQYFGLAQRRKRVFVVGYLGDWRPAAAVLFEPTSLRGDPAPRREAGERVAPTVARGSPGGRTYGLDADTADSLIPQAYDILGVPATQGGRATDIHTALRARAPGGSEASTTTVVAHVPSISPALKARDFKGPSSDGDGDGAPLIAHALRAEGFDASEDGTGRGVPLVAMPLRAGRQYSDMGDGTANVVPVVAASLTSGKGNEGNPAGRRQEDDTNLVPFSGGAHANAAKTGPVEALRALRCAVGEEAFCIWGLGVLAAFWPQEVLRSDVHGRGFRRPAEPQRGLVHFTLSRAQGGASWTMRDLWSVGCDGCPPSGWELPEQRSRELGSHLSKLPYAPSPAQSFLHDLWAAAEGPGFLREALSAVQEARRSACGEGEPARSGLAVRRLTAEEAEALQGFPRSYTLIPYRNGMAADGPRYRALGNSMAVPVLRWIGRRIMAAARLQPPNQGNSDAR